MPPFQIYAPQRTLDWHVARRGRFGASTAAVPLGISEYNSPESLWRMMFDPGLDPRIWDFPSNEATEHGTRFEPLACMLYERLTGNTVFQTGLWMHPEVCPVWLHASPDGFVRESELVRRRDASKLRLAPDGVSLFEIDGALEIKCPLYKMYESPPALYVAQVQRQAAILDVEWVDFFVYFREEACASLWRIHRCRDWERWAVERTQRFLDCRTREQAYKTIPWLSREMQMLIDTQWDWRATARKYGRTEAFLRQHLPTTPLRIDFRWRMQLAAAA